MRSLDRRFPFLQSTRLMSCRGAQEGVFLLATDCLPSFAFVSVTVGVLSHGVASDPLLGAAVFVRRTLLGDFRLLLCVEQDEVEKVSEGGFFGGGAFLGVAADISVVVLDTSRESDLVVLDKGKRERETKDSQQ